MSIAAFMRGCLSSMPRRNSTGSLPAFLASSSMKLSIANQLLLGPTPRQKPVGTPGARPARTRREVGNVVHHIGGAVHSIDIDTLLKRRRQPARDDCRAREPCVASAAILPFDKRCRHAMVIDRPINIVRSCPARACR